MTASQHHHHSRLNAESRASPQLARASRLLSRAEPVFQSEVVVCDV